MNDHEALAVLAKTQIRAACEIRAIVTRLRESGATWRSIAATLGMNYQTLWEQYHAGGPIVVVRPKGVEAAKKSKQRLMT